MNFSSNVVRLIRSVVTIDKRAYTIAFATLGIAPTLAVFVIVDVIRQGSQLLAGAHKLFSSPIVIQIAMVLVAALWVTISIRLAAWQRSLATTTTSDHHV